MEHKGTRIIQGDGVILRPFRADDSEAMFEGWTSDTLVTRYLRYKTHQDIKEAQDFLDSTIEKYSQDDWYIWGIESQETGQLIGSVGMFMSGAPMDECFETGYCLGQSFWGKGYGTKALKALIKFAFEQVGIKRLEAYHATTNPSSGAVMKKAGMAFEGIARKQYTNRMGTHDAAHYGITNDMYFGKWDTSFCELTARALAVASSRVLSSTASCASVGAAILTDKGSVYTGVCIDTSCSMGFCAEHSAASAMITMGESRIKKIVAVHHSGEILPPCGRCREFLSSLNKDNGDALVLVKKGTEVRLKELLPFDWREGKGLDFEKAVIESQRLKLVPINEGHIDKIFEVFDEGVTTYMYPHKAKDVSETAAFVKGSMKKRSEGKEMVFAITLKETGEFLGCFGIHEIDSFNIELGIWTKAVAHGNGYGLEAASAGIVFIREKLPFNYIVYPVDGRNIPSKRIPLTHGGVLKKTYEVRRDLGREPLQIEEYHIY